MVEPQGQIAKKIIRIHWAFRIFKPARTIKCPATSRNVDDHPPKRRIFARVLVYEGDLLGRKFSAVQDSVDEEMHGDILKVDDIEALCKRVNLNEGQSFNIVLRLVRPHNGSGVDPDLEALKHCRIVFRHLDRLLLSLFEAPIERCFEVGCGVAEKIFVNGEYFFVRIELDLDHATEGISALASIRAR